jgi:hypothetical protein
MGQPDYLMSFSWCKIVFAAPPDGPARALVLDIHFWGIAPPKYFESLAGRNSALV